VLSIIGSVKGLFAPAINLTGHVYVAEEHTGWGNAISWHDYDKRRLYGFLSRLPQNGDEIHFKMKSGKIARFAVQNVEYCDDPRDMWFADAVDIGYVGEAPMTRVRK